jgi:hypothetical protein
MLGAIGTVIGWTLFGLTVLQAVFDGMAAGTHKESWTAFAFDIVALAAFGMSKAAEVLAKGLAEGAEAVGKTVAAKRAGQAALRARGVPGFLFSIASRSGLATSVLRVLGMGNALDAAAKAAADAGSAVETVVKAAKSGTLTTLWTMSDHFSGNLAKIEALNKEVPGVLRITVPRILTQGVAGVDGAFQWSAFAGSGYFTMHGILAGS